MKDYLPQIVGFVLFVLGLLGWQKQLLDRRRFEVAEQAIVTFNRVMQAMGRLREHNQTDWTAFEARTDEIPTLPARFAELRKALFDFDPEALKNYEKESESLRPAYVLAKMYLTPKIAETLLELEGVWYVVDEARERLLRDPAPLDLEKLSEEEQKYMKSRFDEIDIDGTYLDPLGQDMEDYRADLERMCAPYLRPPSLPRFVVGLAKAIVGKSD